MERGTLPPGCLMKDIVNIFTCGQTCFEVLYVSLEKFIIWIVKKHIDIDLFSCRQVIETTDPRAH